MKRKDFIKQIGCGAGAITFSPLLISCFNGNSVQNGEFQLPLELPSELTGANSTLNASSSNIQIGDSYSLSAFRFNDSLPAPTIRKKRGDTVQIHFENNIGQESIIHWHGLIVSPDMDGHPKDAFTEGSYDYQYTINQRAGTYWYHPHPHRITGPQVYKGLAGFYFIEDEEEQALNLPSGDHEIPLVIQDRRADGNDIVYNPSMPDRMMSGYLGDLILVNGVPTPFHEVGPGYYRLRILNGSNARIYNLSFENDAPFTVIGTDGGLLPKPLETNELLLAPGERADILVDFSTGFNQDRVKLISKTFDVPSGGMMGMQNMMGGNFEQGTGFSIMEFRITKSDSNTSFELPDQLSKPDFPSESNATKNRPIQLDMQMGQGHTINGRLFEMERVDERVKQGDTEIWELINNSSVPHPMHVHAVQFKVLDRSGNRGLIPTETGWKDTVLVMPGETVRVIMKFDAQKGIYVFHCHNLEHEDNGMMANLEIV